MEVAEEIEIAIVGGGICGLATALALHRKGLRSVVLERSESLRATGAAITIRPNGWRALDELGVASKLRQTAVPLQGTTDICLNSGKQREIPIGGGETRCLKRTDLITALADSLPRGTIRLGCQALSVKLDSSTTSPSLHLQNGSSIKAKVLIGCDGANSVVADFLDLKPTKLFSLSAVRGFTMYPSGHNFENKFVQVRSDKCTVGRMPIHNKLVYWVVIQRVMYGRGGLEVPKDPELIQQLTLEAVKDFPSETIDMISNSDIESLSKSRLRYRSPWDILAGNFRKGSVTVAGDAMHPMGPFLAQGGAVGIEDSVVIARCLAQKLAENYDKKSRAKHIMMMEVEEALDKYVKERRMRLVQLSTQSFLAGLLHQDSSGLVKFLCVILMAALFRDMNRSTRFDCGRL
ncbi:uncharacterized protein LOC110762177 isoform X2 [Prunus avium]|uniref:Uncharacterized protein LOC110762177 isoform X2 n=1 Tax=Prunus avium TaxID=42229 RepID=A0A6P5T1W4_PRUAV|nr:uncharacterized protein LOC110762177 isoform X2 [Prunus avium]